MANLKNKKTLFFTTSPRTPAKMIPEIKLLCEKFTGKVWTEKEGTQAKFMEELVKDESFQGRSSLDGKTMKQKSFSARDRINRAPKSLGFVDLKPIVQITEAGKTLIKEKTIDEIMLRQLLKFQLPSPYHKKTEDDVIEFNVKPYLEIIRLVKVLDGITFDELKIFGMQLTNYKDFEKIVDKIKLFRANRKKTDELYKQYFKDCQEKELKEIYRINILEGNFFTREQKKERTQEEFLKIQARNLRDYTDACFRYLRSTGLFTISYKQKKLSIMKEKIKDVDFILKRISREPIYINNNAKYKDYLFSSNIPELYTDNKENLLDALMKAGSFTKKELSNYSIENLKKLKTEVYKKNREIAIAKEVKRLKSYDLYTEVTDTYDQIIANELYDAPLMFEWNTWRALTMLNGGKITGNFIVDDFGRPMSTAPGSIADIVCDYENFSLTVEVTLQTGKRQYEMEGEPVARHLAKYKKVSNRNTYCLFIAKNIHLATIAHFFVLYEKNVHYYGGNSIILPLELDVFMKMIDNSYVRDYVPDSRHIESLFKKSQELAKNLKDEREWFSEIGLYARSWPYED